MNVQTCDPSMVDPRFSVIIPVFNGQRFIGDAIRSVLEQRYPAHEIIVIDDGSTDSTRDAVRNLATTPPLRYFYQSNQGPAVARNNGARQATGDWLAFLDADDLWQADKLLVQADGIRHDARAVMIWCSFDGIDESGQPKSAQKQKDPFRSLIFQSAVFPIPSTTVVRRDIFETLGGFNPALRRSEDAEFFMRLAAQFPSRFINQPLSCYRVHERQASRTVRAKTESWKFLYESLLKLCGSDSARLAALEITAARNHTYWGKLYLRRGELQEARRHFRLSFAHEPFSWPNLRRWMLSYLPLIREFYRRNKKHATRS